ncbi:MAG: EamA family transporter [Gammaproteobacteria bacterium]|nr:EamA family transporter [Gammaproteobacteria bacterium]
MQSSLTTQLGTLGATQVRFLYGFPFALLFLAAVALVSASPIPRPDAPFLVFTTAGALAQIMATALMLAAMRVRSFSVATAFTKTEAVQAALFGLIVLGEQLTPLLASAIAIATCGVFLAAVRPGAVWHVASVRAALHGVAAGGLFAVAAVGFRGGILALDDGAPFYLRATTTLVWSLGIQAALLAAWLWIFRRAALLHSFVLWRSSIFAGFMGAFASQFWFLAFSLTAAANVRTLGLVEVLFAQVVSRRLFEQRLTARETVGMALLLAGVALLLLEL